MGGKRVTGPMPVETARPPKQVAILLAQSVGAPCRPLVKAGDYVYMGQKVGEPAGFVGTPVHASVSGKVLGIQPRAAASGASVQAVVIENDGLDQLCPDLKPWTPPAEIDGLKDSMLKAIREAGIVGLGGAAFPTAIKLNPPGDKKIDTLILNGAECEPYLTSDHRAMLEDAAQIVDGIGFAQQILGAQRVCVGIEENKPDAIEAMRKACEGKNYEIVPLKTKYPQGGEKQLIHVLTGREVKSGKLPMDSGCVVINVSTAAAISVALRTGRPVIERTVTVTGEVARPKNLRVRVGESVESLIEQCGGITGGADKVVMGGPMMGMSLYSLQSPVVKGTSGILVMHDETAAQEPPGNCIRCASCVDACPIHLVPLRLYALSKRARFAEAGAEHAMDCIECGCCSYICPAKLPLVQSIRVAKREIVKLNRKKA